MQAKKLKLLELQRLTSLDNNNLKEIGYNKTVKKFSNSSKLNLAKKANLDALVCSAHESKYVKKIFKKEIITPGIRLNSKSNDQKRIMTPQRSSLKKSVTGWLSEDQLLKEILKKFKKFNKSF